MSAIPVLSSSEQQKQAGDLLTAMRQLSSHGPRKYLYVRGLDIESLTPSQAGKGYKKMPLHSMAAVATYAAQNCFEKQELLQLKQALLELKLRLVEKRSGNIIKKIWTIFLSCLSNWYHGMGFHDSLSMIDTALGVTNAQLANCKLAVEGPITFKSEERTFLLEAFSVKNLRCFTSQGNGSMLIEGKQARFEMDAKKHSLEFDQFPGLVFKLPHCNSDDTYGRAIYHRINEARRVCAADRLDRLVVPEVSLITCSYLTKSSAEILVVRKTAAKPSEHYTPLTKAQEAELQELVRQLSVLICKTGFSSIARHALSLQEASEIGLHLVLDQDHYFYERTGNCEGLCRWGWGGRFNMGEEIPEFTKAGLMGLYPQYAELILDAAELYLPEKGKEECLKTLREQAQRAARIVQYKKAQEASYRSKGIFKDSPAIPPSILNELQANEIHTRIWKGLIDDINEVIKKQIANQADLVYGRQWRLTRDLWAEDSNRRENVCKYWGYIRNEMLPKLQELGVVSHLFNARQATEYDIDLRRRVTLDDWIVQF